MVSITLPKPVLVTNLADYQLMINHLLEQKAIGIDTESNSLYVYRERICLIQISSETKDFLLDPFCFNQLNELGEILKKKDIQKIFHSGDYDIACLKRDYGFEVKTVFDTMLAATALAEPNLGLGNLLEKYCDVKLEKKYQRANWGERPLKPEMLTYAQADSHYLICLRDCLIPLLAEKKRLLNVLEDSEAIARLTEPMAEHQENIWRVKGAKDLKPRALSLLQALNHFREIQAEKLDRPPFKVMSDRALIEIAQTMPKFIQELSLLPSLSEGQVRRFGTDIMRVVENWRKKPGKVVPPRNGRISDEELQRRDRLSNWRKKTGLKEGVPSNVVLPKDLLERIAHKKVDSLESLAQIMAYSPHRFLQYGEAIYLELQRELE